MDRQISRYWWAVEQLVKGIGSIEVPSMDNGGELHWVPVKNTIYWEYLQDREVCEFIYNIIKKNYPVHPKEIKKGLSQDKRQRTTYALYMEKIRELGLDEAEYSEYLAFLKEREETGDPYFRRIKIYRTPSETSAAINEFFFAVLDAERRRASINEHADDSKLNRQLVEAYTYRNITKDCPNDCQFLALCQATLTGADVGFLRDTLYTQANTELENDDTEDDH
jgi:hypothetical protein